MEDWRLTNQQDYLYGKKLKCYDILDFPNIDHEHCEFCWGKISKHEESFRKAYADEKLFCWICQKCFDDFKELFKWEVI